MRKNLSIILFLCLLAFAIAFSGCEREREGREPAINGTAALPVSAVSDPNDRFVAYYQPVDPAVQPAVPPYSLPLNLSKTANFKDVAAKLRISKDQPLLAKNGFVALDSGRDSDIIGPYETLKARGVPIFVTSDTLLHLYHVQFDETLKDIEEREFIPDLVALTEAMLAESQRQRDSYRGDLKVAAERNVSFFSVGLRILSPEAQIPDYVSNAVNSELGKIEKHQGFAPSDIFIYKEDYSQYVPRGHYTRSEDLKKYFKAMMWYGRMAFLLKAAIVSEQDAKIQTLQASLISLSADKTQAQDGRTVTQIWDRIYSVTAFYVGLADDLTLYDYRDSIRKVFGSNVDLPKLATEDGLFSLKKELALLPSPRIYGGTGDVVLPSGAGPKDLDRVLGDTKGLRFMGQRFIPDSYMFQQLVWPAIGEFRGKSAFTHGAVGRVFPRGLDAMTLLGSKRARQILHELGDDNYDRYDDQLKKLQDEFGALSEKDWNRNLYWSWLYALKALLVEFGPGYPSFMQTQAWQTKELDTVLASWTSLRHDTILYAKLSGTPQGYGPPPPKPVQGYVEPVPEFYARLLALARMTNRGLDDMKVLNKTAKSRLNSLEEILDRLLKISQKELQNKELSKDDYSFIRNFCERLDSLVSGIETREKETRLVADVHTDFNSNQVLEEGCGYVRLLLVAYKQPDGRIVVGAGPLTSYYEFKQPMSDRLTDEKWREMVRSAQAPKPPEWTSAYLGAK